MKLSSLFFTFLAGVLLLPAVASAELVLTAAAPTTIGNSANNKTGNAGQDMRENLSSIALIDAGGSVPDAVNAFVDASIRYAAINTVDRDNNGSGFTRTATHSWQVDFTVSAPINSIYDLQIDTRRLGALTSVNDNSNLIGVSSANISAMTGSYTGPGTLAGGLNLGSQGYATEFSSRNDAINQSTTLNVTGILGTGAAQNFSLSFSWTSFVETTGGSSFSGSSDEAAVRMGMATTYAQISAGSYPGPGSRTMANDGHFVDIRATMTVVPEPSTYVLAGLSVLSFGAVALRRRRANA